MLNPREVGIHITFMLLLLLQVVACVESGKLKDHQLENKLGDHERAVSVRRNLFERRIGRSMVNLPVQVTDDTHSSPCQKYLSVL